MTRKTDVIVFVAPRMAEFERVEHLEPAIEWEIKGEFRGGDDIPEAEIRHAAEMVIERLKAARDGKVTERMKSFQDEIVRDFVLTERAVKFSSPFSFA
jgi:hypothetical protein